MQMEWNIWVKHWRLTLLSLNWIFSVRKRMIELLFCFANIEFLLLDNNVGEEGVKYLSEALKVNSTLTQLDLSCT